MSSADEDDRPFFDAETSRSAKLTAADDSQRIASEREINARDPEIPPSTTTASIARPRTSPGLSSKSQHHRHSLQEAVPAIPAIPARFLRIGRPASISGSTNSPDSRDRLRRDVSRGAQVVPGVAPRVERPRTSAGRRPTDNERALSYDDRQTSWNNNNSVVYAQQSRPDHDDRATQLPASTRRKVLPSIATGVVGRTQETARAVTSTEDMARRSRGKEEDLFLELARDNERDEVRPPSRIERVARRLSQSGKRRSLPADTTLTSSAERRPKSSGNAFPHSSSRLSGFPPDLQRHMDRYRQSPGRASVAPEDAVSVSGRSVSGRAQQFAGAPDSAVMPSRLAERMRSPELPSFGRRRPSYGAAQAQSLKDHQGHAPNKAQDSQEESPADSSEPKRSLPDSASVGSTADTVWDELDDLKSRIKKLELTGKLPPTSGAAVSGDSSDRPRTATTAPTTIESSPKHDRKPEAEQKPATNETSVGGPSAANIHPLLHAALTKAKPLLNGTLYRSLEATAADALQLAAMTGSAGPQGTTFSAASIINGVSVSDRHVRRKADTMCRNLTDLTLALCEGKHEVPSLTASPVVLGPVRNAPSIRYSRTSLGRGDSPGRPVDRPMSRLEARRTSILGLPPTGSVSGNSVRESADEVSASEQENTPSQPEPQLRRASRANSRLLSARMPRYGDVSGDEDPTIRPPSRAMTDIGKLRVKPSVQREHKSHGQPESLSLRSGLAARRSNAGAFEANREQSRVMSLNSDAGRRRWDKESTPPVMEEEMNDSGEYQPSSQPRRRITSLRQFSSRRAADLPNRTPSLGQRSQVVVE